MAENVPDDLNTMSVVVELPEDDECGNQPVPSPVSLHEADSLDDLEVETINLSEEQDKSLNDINCLVNVNFLFQQIFLEKHAPFDCNITDMEFVANKDGTVQWGSGLNAYFILKCKMCNKKSRIFATTPQTDMNKVAVASSLSVGMGYTQTNEFLAHLNVPYVGHALFKKNEEALIEPMEQIAWQTMSAAAVEERDFAISEGNIDSDGIPCITVITDGAWSKHSYDVNYNALSGVACIIGHHT